MTYSAAERKDIRKAEKAAAIAEGQRADFIRCMMSDAYGRTYAYTALDRCHIFATSFNRDPLQMAFNEGERNSGLQLLNDILTYCPDQYILMMREARQHDRHDSDDRTSRSEYSGSPNGDGRVETSDDPDYDPYGGDEGISYVDYATKHFRDET